MAAEPLRLIHTNDLHGRLTPEKLPFLLGLRADADLYFDTGDVVRTGNLGVPLRREPAWGLLAQARCDASVLGNRESHLLESAFHAKLAGAEHPVLCANLRRKDGTRPLPGHVRLEAAGLRVGVFGVSVAMVTERMRTKVASAYLWDPPLPTAMAEAERLRPEVDLLICLSHLGIVQDRELAERAPGIDLILGGHSHTVLETPERVGSTWIAQGGSHGRYIGRYVWGPGAGLSAAELVAWP